MADDITWLTDMVTTELRRAYPETVGKGALEEATGAGPGQLREAIAALEEDGSVVARGDSYVYVDVEDRALGQTLGGGEDPGDPEDELRDLTEEVVTPDPAAQAALGADSATGDTRYQTTLIIEVTSYPELLEGEEEDAAVLRESTALAEAAHAGINARFAGLPVAATVAKIEAFDSPRQVFPG